ncbi:MAG TPA: beta-N-acetylhexosaminidase [Chryseolinea sp.]
MNFRHSLVILSVAVVIAACKESHPPTDLTKENLIPIPVSVQATAMVFEVTNETQIYVEGSDLLKVGQYLADKLRPATGYEFKVSETTGEPRSGNIYITTEGTDATLGDEGYELTITEELLTLASANPAGAFRGVQTVRQLLPDSIELNSLQKGPWEIATGTIRDYPTYVFRSAMLDVARHFFSVEDVKRYIDLIAGYKLNALHLHLTDDQGWRIEIKSWPNLATHGGSTQVGGAKGGYYTQEEYREIVKYAGERYITIIPEVDLPGHTNAALSSYPELNCNGKAPGLYTGTEVGFSTLCVDKEVTYKFVDDVMRELAAMTPGPYIHLGGDESHATKKADFIKFVNKSQEIVLSHGKKPIGWEEISQGTLQPGTVVQYWSNAEHAKVAVKNGSKIIISPAKKSYLDMSYDSTSKLGLHWAAYIEVDSAYLWDPASLVEGITQDDILGVESPLWSETLTTMDDIEYMAFPRILGHAEIGWSPAAARNWDEYKVRLGKHAKRLTAKEINFYRSRLVPWVE